MSSGVLVRRLGGLLFFAGLAAFAGIFLIVMINGTWPVFLRPVQTLYSTLGDYFGNWAIIIEGWLFLGPGLLLVKVGEVIERKPKQP